MVGALSIVRFRTAIKEPMDIAFLFWSIAAGIVLAAGMLPLAVIGSLVIGNILLVFIYTQIFATAVPGFYQFFKAVDLLRIIIIHREDFTGILSQGMSDITDNTGGDILDLAVSAQIFVILQRQNMGICVSLYMNAKPARGFKNLFHNVCRDPFPADGLIICCIDDLAPIICT